MVNFPKAVGHAYRIYSYFMAGLGLALIFLLYLLDQYLQAWRDL